MNLIHVWHWQCPPAEVRWQGKAGRRRASYGGREPLLWRRTRAGSFLSPTWNCGSIVTCKTRLVTEWHLCDNARQTHSSSISCLTLKEVRISLWFSLLLSRFTIWIVTLTFTFSLHLNESDIIDDLAWCILSRVKQRFIERQIWKV